MRPCLPPIRWRPHRGRAHAATATAGFSLLDALLASCIGLVLAMGLLQSLLADGRLTQRWRRQIHERQTQARLFDLLRSDLSLTTAVSSHPELEIPACPLAGRQPVLHLATTSGPITYSVGAAPSGIWRGRVLMRCGPAYGLDGTVPTGSLPSSRVVLDALPAPRGQSAGCPKLLAADERAQDLNGSGRTGLTACLVEGGRLLAVAVEQVFPRAQSAAGADASPDTIRQEQLFGIGF